MKWYRLADVTLSALALVFACLVIFRGSGDTRRRARQLEGILTIRDAVNALSVSRITYTRETNGWFSVNWNDLEYSCTGGREWSSIHDAMSRYGFDPMTPDWRAPKWTSSIADLFYRHRATGTRVTLRIRPPRS